MTDPLPLIRKAEEYLAAAEKKAARGELEPARRDYLAAGKAYLEAARNSGGSTKDTNFAAGALCIDKAKSIPLQVREQPSKSKDLDTTSLILMERPDVRFEDIAGLDSVKEKIRDIAITSQSDPEKARKWRVKTGGGILLFGPPGTGKTYIAKATAGEINAPFISVKASDIMSKWVGESEQRIAELFMQARSYERSVLFIDEIDALLPRRSRQSSTIMQRVVPQFLAEMDGVDTKNSNVLILAATNEPWNIDYAALRPGRFDYKIYIPPPDFEARMRLFQLNLDVPRTENFDFDMLASLTEGYSGADIALICAEARGEMYKMDVSGIASVLSPDVVERHITAVSPSIQRSDLERFSRFISEGTSS
jgi:transitional endoplasmic reticulum ATPase